MSNEQDSEAFLTDPHVFEHKCNKKIGWCKIHHLVAFLNGKPTPMRYPWYMVMYSSRFGWTNTHVHCGPQAFLPKRPPKQETKDTTYKPPF